MQTTQQKILDRLTTSPPATAAELARSLNMTRANIRYHLHQLMSSGFVVVAGKAHASRRGRPALLYASTLKASEGELAPLILGLWDLLIEGAPRGRRQQRVGSLASHIASGYALQGTSSPMHQRLNQALLALSSLGYRSRWEAHPDSPHLILDRCPFDGVFDRLPAICDLDGAVLEAIMGLPVEQIARRKLIAGRGSACIFRLREEA